jgi:D-sedoheptulose 7-phosphate isomerase
MEWDRIAEVYLEVADQIFRDLKPAVERLADMVADRLRQGGKIMLCGNGGSAADAQHFAGEMVNRFLKDRAPLAAVALSTDTSIMTSIANDYTYDQVFEKQVQALGRAGDVLVGISTSGNAANVCRAVQTAREKAILTIALTGGNGGRLAGLVDEVVSVSCTDSTPRIQEGHQLIIHALCGRIEEILT